MDRMQIVCSLLQTYNHTSTTSLKYFYRPDALSDAQPTVSKHWRQSKHWSNENDRFCKTVVVEYCCVCVQWHEQANQRADWHWLLAGQSHVQCARTRHVLPWQWHCASEFSTSLSVVLFSPVKREVMKCVRFSRSMFLSDCLWAGRLKKFVSWFFCEILGTSSSSWEQLTVFWVCPLL